jgi:hypothetical protein
MKNNRIRDTTRLTALIAVALTIAGCSQGLGGSAKPGEVVGWSDAQNPPPGLIFSNGMPPSSDGPSPKWYAKRFSRARGIGEAIKQNRRSLWDRDSGTFVYYMGSVLSAHYHPWEHYLEIRGENKGENNIVCHWTQEGALAISTIDKSPAPAGAGTACQQLMDRLARHVDPSGTLMSGS